MSEELESINDLSTLGSLGGDLLTGGGSLILEQTLVIDDTNEVIVMVVLLVVEKDKTNAYSNDLNSI